MWIQRSCRCLLDEIMPRSCAFCGALRHGVESNLCAACRDDLPQAQSACPPASSPLSYSIAALRYEFPVDVAIKAFKFKRKLFYASAFAEILCEACEQLPQDIDAVLPVPLHWRRKMMRGFNQSMELARPVARYLRVPIIHNVVRRHATDFQSALSVTERKRNLHGAFSIRRSLVKTHILIVDDVVTTGTTANALATTLLRDGVSKVSLLALAKAQ